MEKLFKLDYQTTPLRISYHDNAHWGRLGIVPTLGGESNEVSEVLIALAGPESALKEWLKAEYPDSMESLDDAEELDQYERAAYFAAVKEQHGKGLDHLINTDLRWLMARMLGEFPGLSCENDIGVSGPHLVDFLIYQLSNMPNLRRLKLKDPLESVQVIITD